VIAGSEPPIIDSSNTCTTGSQRLIERHSNSLFADGLAIVGTQSPAPSASTLSLGTETPATSATPGEVPTPPPVVPNADGKENESENQKQEEDDPRKRRGWPNRYPFRCYNPWQKSKKEGETEKRIYWGELTLKEKLDYRKAFLKEYLTETKKCLPSVRKLFVMIYRLSPWRAATILTFNIVNGLLPALTLQTRGNFLMMVYILTQKRLTIVTIWSREGNIEPKRLDWATYPSTCSNSPGKSQPGDYVSTF
jgi:hypothetical protein